MMVRFGKEFKLVKKPTVPSVKTPEELKEVEAERGRNDTRVVQSAINTARGTIEY